MILSLLGLESESEFGVQENPVRTHTYPSLVLPGRTMINLLGQEAKCLFAVSILVPLAAVSIRLAKGPPGSSAALPNAETAHWHCTVQGKHGRPHPLTAGQRTLLTAYM